MNIALGDSGYYERFTYPAGETQVRLTETGVAEVSTADTINITARIRSGDDIMALALLRDAIRDVTLAPVHLTLPYLPYSRADRRFTRGDCAGLLTFGDQIDSIGFSTVTTWDAHNPMAASGCISGFKDLGAIPTVIGVIGKVSKNGVITVLYPDKGAADRYVLPPEIACNTASIKVTVLKCEKQRDPATGKFLGFTVPEVFPAGPVLIVDDICDGGGTFLGIADAIAHHNLDLSLYVTHGIFSKGVGELLKRFTEIFSTDSFPARDGVSLVTFHAR